MSARLRTTSRQNLPRFRNPITAPITQPLPVTREQEVPVTSNLPTDGQILQVAPWIKNSLRKISKTSERPAPRCFFREVENLTDGKFKCSYTNMLNGFCSNHRRYVFNTANVNNPIDVYDARRNNTIRMNVFSVRIFNPYKNENLIYEVWPIPELQPSFNEMTVKFGVLAENLRRSSKYSKDAYVIYKAHVDLYKFYVGSVNCADLSKEKLECLMSHYAWQDYVGQALQERLNPESGKKIDPQVVVSSDNGGNYLMNVREMSIISQAVLLSFHPNYAINNSVNIAKVVAVPAVFYIHENHLVMDGSKCISGTKCYKNTQTIGNLATFNINRVDNYRDLYIFRGEYTDEPIKIRVGNCKKSIYDIRHEEKMESEDIPAVEKVENLPIVPSTTRETSRSSSQFQTNPTITVNNPVKNPTNPANLFPPSQGLPLFQTPQVSSSTEAADPFAEPQREF